MSWRGWRRRSRSCPTISTGQARPVGGGDGGTGPRRGQPFALLPVDEKAQAVVARGLEDEVPQVHAEGQHRIAAVARAAGADARGAGGQLTSVRTEEDEADLVLCLQFGRRDQESHDQREVRVPQGEDRASEAAHTAAQDRELAARLGRGGVGGEGGGGG